MFVDEAAHECRATSSEHGGVIRIRQLVMRYAYEERSLGHPFIPSRCRRQSRRKTAADVRARIRSGESLDLLLGGRIAVTCLGELRLRSASSETRGVAAANIADALELTFDPLRGTFDVRM